MSINPFKLERFFAKHEFTAKHLLCSSDCEAVSLETVLDFEESSREQLDKLWLGYTESSGSPTLRNEICKLYNSIQPKDILVHSGAEEAIYSFMKSMLSPSDHIIVQYPGYQSSSEVAKNIGCEVTHWCGSEENIWQPDLNFLTDNIKKNTKAIYINFPHNPTGFYPDSKYYNELNEIAQKHDLIVFSDEVFRNLEQDGVEPLPNFCDINEKAVSLGVMSKSFGLAGLRIGWIATKNRDVYNAMASYKDYLTICSSAPSEFISELALRHKEKLLKRNNDIIKNNLVLLDEFFDKHSSMLEWIKPKAGPIAFPKFTLGKAASEISESLLEKTGVLILPGNLYHTDYSNHFRLGFGKMNFKTGLDLFDGFLSNL